MKTKNQASRINTKSRSLASLLSAVLIFSCLAVTAYADKKTDADSFDAEKTAEADNLTLYSTSFEQPIFPSGSQLLGLDGWSTAIPPFLNPAAAIITDAVASNRKQSVEVRGEDLNSSPIDPSTNEYLTAPYAAVGSYRRPLGQDINANNSKVYIDADLLLKTNQPATLNEFFSHTIAARSGDGETLGEIGLSSSGEVEAFDFNAVSGAPPAFAEPISLNRWHHIRMVLDYKKRTTFYYIDDHFLGKTNTPSTSNILLRAAMVVYARPDGAGNVRSNYTARFDKFRVNVNNDQD
jgi:hypothetical protein